MISRKESIRDNACQSFGGFNSEEMLITMLGPRDGMLVSRFWYTYVRKEGTPLWMYVHTEHMAKNKRASEEISSWSGTLKLVRFGAGSGLGWWCAS